MIEKIVHKGRDNMFRIFIGGIFLLLGIAMIEVYVGYLLITICVFLLFYSTGIEFDLEKNRVREYRKFLGKYKETWLALEKFNTIEYRKTKKGIRRYGGRTSASFDSYNLYYAVSIKSDELKKRIVLKTFKLKTEAEEYIKIWSKKLGFVF